MQCKLRSILRLPEASYVNRDIVAGELPGVKVQPIVGNFHLVTVDDFLLEDSVSVAKTVAPGGIVERSQAVEEAGSKSAQATVAQTSVMLLADDILNSKAKFRETVCIEMWSAKS